jgi:LacI family transcriptional regulator
VAAAAGVRVATVDRVLNRHHPVRPDTARRVLEAAERLGYHGTSLIRSRLQAHGRACRFGFLLQRESSAFYRRMATDFEVAVREAGPGHSAIIDYVNDLDVPVLVDRMHQLGRRADAIGVAVDHPRVSEQIARLREGGVPTFALLSDVSAPERAGYIGVDPQRAGRTAAWAITRLSSRPGAAAIFVGTHRHLDHDSREISLRSYLRELAPGFRLLEAVVDLDQPDVAYEAALGLLNKQSDLVGIYTTAAGVAGVGPCARRDRPWPRGRSWSPTSSQRRTSRH